MTPEDYELIVRALVAARPDEKQYRPASLTYPSDLGMWRLVRNTFSEMLARDNPAFDIRAFEAKTDSCTTKTLTRYKK